MLQVDFKSLLSFVIFLSFPQKCIVRPAILILNLRKGRGEGEREERKGKRGRGGEGEGHAVRSLLFINNIYFSVT